MNYFNSSCNLTELGKRYRKLILENHPDKGGTAEDFQKITEEYERLKLYKNSDSIIKQVGNDITKTTCISINDLFTGTNIEILYEITKYSNLIGYYKSNKTIKLTIPPFFYKNKLVYEEEGDEIMNGTPGKLIVNILIKKDEIYEINGLDIYYNFTLTIKEALIGFKKLIKHPSGTVLTLENDEITQLGSKKIFEKMGLKSINPDKEEYGNFIIYYNIIFPDCISKKDRLLLEKLDI